VGDLLPGLASRLGLGEELRIARAAASWRRVVEELVPAAAGASGLMEIRSPLLIVSASDAATGQELRLHAPHLLDAFAGAPGGERLDELRVVVRGATQGPGEKPL
jgi:hypothetical protein